MRLLFIRHGEPDYEHDSLTESGRREAALLAEKLAGEGITKIYCSPLGRARETASYTEKRIGIKATVLDWLQEFPASVNPPYKELGLRYDTPWGDGLPWNLLPQYWTPSPELYDKDRWHQHEVFKNSEVLSVYNRISGSLTELIAEHGYKKEGNIYKICGEEKQTIALFCHMGLSLALISSLLSISPVLFWHSFFLPPSSVTSVVMEKYPPYEDIAIARVVALGDTSHLFANGIPTSNAGLHSPIE